MLHLLYSALFYLAIPLLVLRQLWRSIKNSGHRERLSERLGYVPRPKGEQPIVHFHLVSVGETLAALPLIHSWMTQHNEFSVYVTCTTLTGSNEIQKRLGDRVTHSYLPYDTPTATRRFYRRVPAKISVIMETELWPNLLHSARKAGVQTLLMNARLSDRSASRYQKLPAAKALLLAPLTKICCQTQETLTHFKNLGATESQLIYTGNLKFDLAIEQGLQQKAQQLKELFGSGRPLWVAGSTHEGEDSVLLEAHQLILKKFPNALLILVPRHPERFEQVAQLIEQYKLPMARRSESSTLKEEALAKAQVFLGDTMGELMLMYQASDVAFVGGSLVKRGGHNPLEPAALKRPILTGPYVFNFEIVYQLLTKANACFITSTAEAIAHKVSQLFSDTESRTHAAQLAYELVQQHKGAKQATIEQIESLVH